MKKLLITGFDPFGGGIVNPSWEAVQLLPEQIGGYRLCKLPLPTVYAEAPAMLLRAAEEIRPDVIISVGLADKRDAVTPERIAVNIRDARIADNRGVFHHGERIESEGPAAYFSTLPVEAMAEAIRNAQIPASVSNTAGAYVCNDVMYSALHRFDGTHVRCGFIHVPNIPGHGEPNLPLEVITRALAAAIETL